VDVGRARARTDGALRISTASATLSARFIAQVVEGVGGPERGYDGAKQMAGRKRHLLVNTTG
jgi:hypothetical protein